MSAKSQIAGVSIDGDVLARFDGWVAARGFASRSSALQHLIREKLDAISVADARGPAVATVTFVYDHHRRDLMERLAHLQHEHLDHVVAATHVHLDHSRCLEVLILRGPARTVRALGQQIVAVRGVERGEVTLTSAAPAPGGAAPDHGRAGPSWHAAAHARDGKKRPAPRRKRAKK